MTKPGVLITMYMGKVRRANMGGILVKTVSFLTDTFKNQTTDKRSRFFAIAQKVLTTRPENKACFLIVVL